MSQLKENMLLAKQAVKYLDKLGITSINVPFRVTSYYGFEKLSRFDCFMLNYMRTETNSGHTAAYLHTAGKSHLTDDRQRVDAIFRFADKARDDKAVAQQIKQVMRDPKLSAGQKKKQLTELMNQTGFDPKQFRVQWFTARTDAPDEFRMRSARRSITFRHGNCGEKSAIAATWLLERTKGTRSILWVSAGNWDHAWALMGPLGSLSDGLVTGGKYKTWSEDVVVIDGWTGDWYPIHHPYNPAKGTAANPFQLYVRKKVQAAEGNVNVMEDLKWPPQYDPAFTLEGAEKGWKSRHRKEVELDLFSLMDDPQVLQDAIDDRLGAP